jgi:predicted nucleotidyltransferase
MARAINQGGGLRAGHKDENGAGVGELAIMKVRAWLDRSENSDMKDLKFLFAKMNEIVEGLGSCSLPAKMRWETRGH